MSKKPIVGDVLIITFYDHTIQDRLDSGPFVCRAYGELAKEDSLYYFLYYWKCQFDGENNDEIVKVLKSSIKHIFIMSKCKVPTF